MVLHQLLSINLISIAYNTKLIDRILHTYSLLSTQYNSTKNVSSLKFIFKCVTMKVIIYDFEFWHSFQFEILFYISNLLVINQNITIIFIFYYIIIKKERYNVYLCVYLCYKWFQMTIILNVRLQYNIKCTHTHGSRTLRRKPFRWKTFWRMVISAKDKIKINLNIYQGYYNSIEQTYLYITIVIILNRFSTITQSKAVDNGFYTFLQEQL